jgi:serine/threonine protein kinase
MTELRKLGRYEIIREIGRGGMSTVHLAYDPVFEREVALKLLPREFLHDPSFRARFEREAKSIAKIEHAAIVPVYDFGEEDGQPFLVMRYMTGGTLADQLEDGPLSIEDAQKILVRLANALGEAHDRGMVHRDIKPRNVLFDHHGDAFLTDFGIVKLTQETTTYTGSGITQ